MEKPSSLSLRRGPRPAPKPAGSLSRESVGTVARFKSDRSQIPYRPSRPQEKVAMLQRSKKVAMWRLFHRLPTGTPPIHLTLRDAASEPALELRDCHPQFTRRDFPRLATPPPTGQRAGTLLEEDQRMVRRICLYIAAPLERRTAGAAADRAANAPRVFSRLLFIRAAPWTCVRQGVAVWTTKHDGQTSKKSPCGDFSWRRQQAAPSRCKLEYPAC